MQGSMILPTVRTGFIQPQVTVFVRETRTGFLRVARMRTSIE